MFMQYSFQSSYKTKHCLVDSYVSFRFFTINVNKHCYIWASLIALSIDSIETPAFNLNREIMWVYDWNVPTQMHAYTTTLEKYWSLKQSQEQVCYVGAQCNKDFKLFSDLPEATFLKQWDFLPVLVNMLVAFPNVLSVQARTVTL